MWGFVLGFVIGGFIAILFMAILRAKTYEEEKMEQVDNIQLLSKRIADILEEVKGDMCDNYCKYPTQTPPEGKDEDWLFDDDSPCQTCPLNKL